MVKMGKLRAVVSVSSEACSRGRNRNRNRRPKSDMAIDQADVMEISREDRTTSNSFGRLWGLADWINAKWPHLRESSVNSSAMQAEPF